MNDQMAVVNIAKVGIIIALVLVIIIFVATLINPKAKKQTPNLTVNEHNSIIGILARAYETIIAFCAWLTVLGVIVCGLVEAVTESPALGAVIVLGGLITTVLVFGIIAIVLDIRSQLIVINSNLSMSNTEPMKRGRSEPSFTAKN